MLIITINNIINNNKSFKFLKIKVKECDFLTCYGGESGEEGEPGR
jgi:hypothetical protein